jgi:hypothetical protein
LKSGTASLILALPRASSFTGPEEQVHGLHPGGRATRLRQCGQRHVATEAQLAGGASKLSITRP